MKCRQRVLGFFGALSTFPQKIRNLVRQKKRNLFVQNIGEIFDLLEV